MKMHCVVNIDVNRLPLYRARIDVKKETTNVTSTVIAPYHGKDVAFLLLLYSAHSATDNAEYQRQIEKIISEMDGAVPVVENDEAPSDTGPVVSSEVDLPF